MQAKQLRAWRTEFERVNERIADGFVRREPRDQARAYLQELLGFLERTNGWQLAECAGDHSPDGIQDFLAHTRWDADAVRDEHVAMSWSIWASLRRHWCSTPVLCSPFLTNPVSSSTSTRALPGASRTARSACFWLIRTAVAMRSSTANCACPNSGRRKRSGGARRMCPMRLRFAPNRKRD
jgi:hypothetical protein